MADKNLVVSLLITAKDQASGALGKLFAWLNDTTNVVASQFRAAFSDIFGGGITSAADFEKTLNAVAAKGGYTSAELAQLSQAADQLGARFGMAGGDVAKGMEVLAAAGLKAKDVIATLPQVLALARLENISLDAASTKLADALSAVGLSFEHAGRMADVLAQGANITLSSTSQLADALTVAGGAARDYGLSLEQTVAVLDLLHKNGLKGAEAGTALRGILLQLLDPASQAGQAIADLGGDVRDFGTVLRVLAPQTQATNAAILAFGTESSTAIRALRQEGTAGLTAFTSELVNAAGAAQTAADQMGAGLTGATDALAAAWDALKRNLLTPLLEPLAQQARALAEQLNGLAQSPGIRQFGEALAAGVKTTFGWLERLATEGVGLVQKFVGGLTFAQAAQKVADAKDNIVRLVGAGLDTVTSAFVKTAAGIVQTTTQLVVDIKTGIVGVLDAIRRLPIVQGEIFDRLSESIRALKQGLPELAAVAQSAAVQSAAAQEDYNRNLARTRQAYEDLKNGAGEYERSVREGAARMGVGEREYIEYLKTHSVELQKLIPIELERLQSTTDVQARLLDQTQQLNTADRESFDLAKILAAAGADELEIKRQLALASGEFSKALAIEREQLQAAAGATEGYVTTLENLDDAYAYGSEAAKRFSDRADLVAERNAKVGQTADQAAQKTEAVTISMARFRQETAYAFDLRGIGRYNAVIGDIKNAIDDANQAAARLATQGIGAASTQSAELADELLASSSYLDDAAHAAGTNLKTALAQARQEAASLSATLAQMAEDFRRQILQIKGDQKTLLDLEHADTLKKLEELHARAGQLGNDEYEEAVRRANELHALKLRQLQDEQRARQSNAGSGGGSSAGTGTGGGSGVTVNVNASNARLLDDQFVHELARQMAPIFGSINRRLN